MTKKETFMFIAKIKTYYNREYMKSDDEMRMIVESWYDMLKSISLENAIICLKRHVGTNKWAPTISDILEEHNKISGPKIVDDGEAWLLARRYHQRNYLGPGVNVGEKDNSDIPNEVIVAVKQIGHLAMMMSENEDVLRSNFLRIYKTIKKRANTENILPRELKTETLREQLGADEPIKKIEHKEQTRQKVVGINENRLLMLEKARKQIGKSF